VTSSTAASPWRLWIPVVLWAALISLFSTHWFTSENTSTVVEPIFRWLLPFASQATIDWLHALVRKSGHVVEYFIFSLLLLRAVRAGRRGLRLNWTLAIILIVGAYASLDEYHQSFVPGRTAAVSDVLLDTSAGVLAQAIAAMFIVRSENRRKPAPA
jgi:VanZ family protein